MKTRDPLVSSGFVYPFLILLALQLSSGFRVPRVDHGDEVWTLGALGQSYGELINFVLRQDNHPPLYYIVAKFWAGLVGASIPHVRVLSYLFALLAVGLFVFFCFRFRLLTLFVPLVFLATNPLFTYYAATIRPYAMVVALASLVTLSALLLRQSGRWSLTHDGERSIAWMRWIFYLGCLLLGLTHYYGTLYVAILLAIDWFERNISWSRIPGSLVFSLLLIWPVFQKLQGSLDVQAKSNLWVKVFPLVSTLNNFLMGTFPSLMVSRQPAYVFSVFIFLCLIVGVCASGVSGAGQKTALGSDLPGQMPEDFPLGGGNLSKQFSPDVIGALLADRRVYLGLIIGLVYLFSLAIDVLITPFSTPYYFLVCLPAVAILFESLCQSIERRLGLWPAFIFLAGVVGCQLILAQQRLALP
ncbi:MAG: hypothetical protein WCL59_02895 [Cyanobium sp. ELA507]